MKKECENCGVTFPRPSKCGLGSWGRRRFCSMSCAGEHRGKTYREHLHSEIAHIIDHDHPESVARRVGYGKAEDLIWKLRATGGEALADKLARNLNRYKRGEMSYHDEEFA